MVSRALLLLLLYPRAAVTRRRRRGRCHVHEAKLRQVQRRFPSSQMCGQTDKAICFKGTQVVETPCNSTFWCRELCGHNCELEAARSASTSGDALGARSSSLASFQARPRPRRELDRAHRRQDDGRATTRRRGRRRRGRRGRREDSDGARRCGRRLNAAWPRARLQRDRLRQLRVPQRRLQLGRHGRVRARGVRPPHHHRARRRGRARRPQTLQLWLPRRRGGRISSATRSRSTRARAPRRRRGGRGECERARRPPPAALAALAAAAGGDDDAAAATTAAGDDDPAAASRRPRAARGAAASSRARSRSSSSGSSRPSSGCWARARSLRCGRAASPCGIARRRTVSTRRAPGSRAFQRRGRSARNRPTFQPACQNSPGLSRPRGLAALRRTRKITATTRLRSGPLFSQAQNWRRKLRRRCADLVATKPTAIVFRGAKPRRRQNRASHLRRF